VSPLPFICRPAGQRP